MRLADRKKTQTEEAAGKSIKWQQSIGFYTRHQWTRKKAAELKVENYFL